MKCELFERIENEIKDAMKAHDALKRDCLRSIVSEIKNQTVNAGKEMTDSICIKVLQKSMKTHNDSIAQFSQAGRDDLAKKEKAEAEIINLFLPKMMDEIETEAFVKSIIDSIASKENRSLAKKDMGTIMKALSSSSSASMIDMKIASKFVLANLN